MTALKWIPHLFLALPMLALIVNNVVPRALIRTKTIAMSASVAAAQMLAALAGFFLLITSGERSVLFGLAWDAEQSVGYFRIDLVSMFLLMCVGMVSLASTLTAFTTIDDHRPSYTNLLMVMMLGLNGMLLVHDLFSLYVFLEVTGVASFVMIGMYKSTRDLEGAFKYLTLSALATIFILTGLSFLFIKAGSLSFDALTPALFTGTADGGTLLCWGALILLVSGYCIKSGVAPFHSWLPDAYESADTAVSIMLSGIVTKIAGVYSLLTLTRLFYDVTVLRTTLAILGVFTIVVGALLALMQTNFKRIAAYSSVSQMGYILLGLSAGTELGIIAALLYLFSHAAAKTALFTNAAALEKQLGTLDIGEMGGLQSRMPVTGFSSVCAFLSTAGVPPFAGFWSKLLILLALWKAGMSGYAAFALIASILTGAYFLRLQKNVFFGKLNPRWNAVCEIKGGIRVSEILLTIVTIGVGLIFPLLLKYLGSAGLI
ncbi:MAG TPA: proton-conducting transporter membrane subunit [Feifaniaceae bacterium]|nr:proton-conducting transporter membrane subunit [Feifaniaceae bacterium]